MATKGKCRKRTESSSPPRKILNPAEGNVGCQDFTEDDTWCNDSTFIDGSDEADFCHDNYSDEEQSNPKDSDMEDALQDLCASTHKMYVDTLKNKEEGGTRLLSSSFSLMEEADASASLARILTYGNSNAVDTMKSSVHFKTIVCQLEEVRKENKRLRESLARYKAKTYAEREFVSLELVVKDAMKRAKKIREQSFEEESKSRKKHTFTKVTVSCRWSKKNSVRLIEEAKRKLSKVIKDLRLKGRIDWPKTMTIEQAECRGLLRWALPSTTKAIYGPDKGQWPKYIDMFEESNLVIVNGYEGLPVSPTSLTSLLLRMSSGCQLYFVNNIRVIDDISRRRMIELLTDYNRYSRLSHHHVIKGIITAYKIRIHNWHAAQLGSVSHGVGRNDELKWIPSSLPYRLVSTDGRGNRNHWTVQRNPRRRPEVEAARMLQKSSHSVMGAEGMAKVKRLRAQYTLE